MHSLLTILENLCYNIIVTFDTGIRLDVKRSQATANREPGDNLRSDCTVTTASIYKQRQDIIEGMPCLNCGQIRWARKGDESVRCQECDSVFQVRTLWAEMSDLPISQPAEPEIHLDDPEFAALVAEYALLDQAERLNDIDVSSATLFDRGQRLQRLEDMLPADVCAAIQLLNERAAHEHAVFASGLPYPSAQ
jgi:hypothetical protein